MITTEDIEKALNILEIPDAFVHGVGYEGIAIDTMNETALQSREYYFETEDEFEKFIERVIL